MLHSKHITFEPGQTEETSLKTRFQVNRGMMHTIWVTYPPGCAGLVKLRLFHEGHPFLPVEKDAFIRGDAITYVYPVMYEIKTAPEQITIEGWNEDDTYSHEIDVQMLIIPKHLAVPGGGVFQNTLLCLAEGLNQ